MADVTKNFPADAGLLVGSVVTADMPISHVRVAGSATTTPFVYVVDSGNHRIQVFDYDGNPLFEFGSFGTGDSEFDSPHGVANDGTRVYVTDSGNNRVQYFTLLGEYLGQWGTFGNGNGEFSSPKGIAVDGHYAYVVDQGNHRFQIFTALGAFVMALGEFGSGTDQFNSPTNCYVDSSYLWIDDTGNSRIVWYLLLPPTTDIYSTFPAFTSSIVTAIRSGAVVGIFPEFTSEIVTSLEIQAVIASAFPAFTSDIAASSPITGVIDSTLPLFTSAIETSQVRVMVLDSTFPAFTSEIVTIGELFSAIDSQFPAFRSEIVSRISGGQTVTVVVINTMIKAVSNYTNYDFNSMSNFAGKNIGANASGIYEMDGDDDDTTTDPVDISAAVRTGDFDLHEGSIIRKLEDANLFGVFGDDITLIFRGNIDTLRTFTVPVFNKTTESTLRQKLGKGLKDRVFSLEYQNTNGANMEIQQATIDAEAIHRTMKRG